MDTSKTWQELIKKYEHNKLMIEFMNYCDEYLFHIELEANMIQDVWGWLICFAETKGWYLEYGDIMGENYLVSVHNTNVRKNGYTYGHPEEKTLESAMFWCADKFFEVVK